MKKASSGDFDKALNWFSQRQAEGNPIAGSMLVEKVKFFNDALSFSVAFNATSSWLHDFKA